MTIKEQIMKLQTYKMYDGEDTVYVERDDVLKALEQQPSEDAISREEVINLINHSLCDLKRDGDKQIFINTINSLPYVTPQRPKGKWIYKYNRVYECYQCGASFDNWANELKYKNYCPNCGAEMEVEE